jgi:hypothetical protein
MIRTVTLSGAPRTHHDFFVLRCVAARTGLSRLDDN